MKVKNINSELVYAQNGIKKFNKELETIQKRRLTLPRLAKNEADYYEARLNERETKANRLIRTFQHIAGKFTK